MMPNYKQALEQFVTDMHNSGLLLNEAMREFKKTFILRVIQECKGNQCQAARLLGMHRNTLSRTIAEMRLWREVRDIRSGVLRRRPVRSHSSIDNRERA